MLWRGLYCCNDSGDLILAEMRVSYHCSTVIMIHLTVLFLIVIMSTMLTLAICFDHQQNLQYTVDIIIFILLVKFEMIMLPYFDAITTITTFIFYISYFVL